MPTPLLSKFNGEDLLLGTNFLHRRHMDFQAQERPRPKHS